MCLVNSVPLCVLRVQLLQFMTAPALVQKLWNYPDFIGACCNIL